MTSDKYTHPLMAMHGIDAMRAMIDNPRNNSYVGDTLGFRLVKVDNGFAAFEGVPSDRMLNPFGIVNGGWALTLLYSACGAAAHTTLPARVGHDTVEMKGNLLRTVRADTGRLRAEAYVVSRERTLITAEAKLTDAVGKIYAHGTTTSLIRYPNHHPDK
ncbi:MAG: PaaI family thioesterase [Hyphomonadaceae bacterium]|nr:PaaI family thioesterase [Hyphomonadaceae bacterium]